MKDVCWIKRRGEIILKRIFTLAAAVLLLITLTLAGCSGGSSNQSAKELLQEAYTKSSDITSSKFDGSMKLNLDLPDSVMEDPDAAMVLNLLNNAELTFRGTSQLDPMMAELFLTAGIKGDMPMEINLSMLVTEETMWVKIPNIPFLPIPAEVAGKYLEIDFAELSELAGEEIANIDPELQQQYQELGAEIMDLFFGAYDEEEYFAKVSKKDANIPTDVNADEVVKFELTNDNLRPFVETFIEILPDLLDKLSEVEEAGINQADIDSMKSEIEASKAEIEEGLDTIEEAVDINEATIITALKDGYITYSAFNVSVDVTNEGETGTLGFEIVMNQKDINKEQSFEISEPGSSEVITLEELMGSIFGEF